jgi:hypothetical protein
MSTRSNSLILFLLLILAGCANITAPTGGKKDVVRPKLVSLSPRDSLTNTRVGRVSLYFNEYITVNNPAKEVQLSPILPIAPSVIGLNKHVTVKIVDSLLEPNTTYRLSFGEAIKDVHEGNAFIGYTYTFSTGAYFDSLQLYGTITNAATGLYDLEGIMVVLHYASENDSAIVRQKPKYAAKVEADGRFSFKGLPGRSFRIYAIKDANDNLIYDGPIANEMVGFMDNNVIPGDTSMAQLNIRVFAEVPDTAAKKKMDASAKEKPLLSKGKQAEAVAFTYSVNVDTSDREKKTFDVTGPVKVMFSRVPELNMDKVTLTRDSTGADAPVRIARLFDSASRTLKISPAAWRENAVYTLRLAKGFAKDTAGNDLPPSRYVFRTKDEDDYGEITLHLPAKYGNSNYLLKVLNEADSVYQKPVTDTVVKLPYLNAGKYTFRIIADKNPNGKWDAGELLSRKQPEEVIPHIEPLNLRAGWKHKIDFEEKRPPKPGMKGGLKKR